jgi:hypothetical protein
MKMKLVIVTAAVISICAALGAGCAEAGAPPAGLDGAALAAEGGDPAAEGVGVKVVYGEISEVIGNALTIKLLERPQISRAGGPEGGAPGNVAGSGVNGEDREEDGAAPSDGGRRYSGGENGDGTQRRNITRNEDGTMTVTMPDGTTQTFDPQNPPEGAVTPGGGNRAQMERRYTGEETEVIIPVGIPVLERTMDPEGAKETEININKLTGGDIITITYKPDGKTIDTVYVSRAGSGGGVFFGGGGRIEIRGEGGGGAMFFQSGEPGV